MDDSDTIKLHDEQIITVQDVLGEMSQFVNIIFNESVTEGVDHEDVTLPIEQADTSFLVLVVPSWLTSYSISNKSTSGYTVSFGTVPPANSTIDYIVLRWS